MALTVSVDEIVHGSRNRLLSVRPHWKRIRLGEIASVLNGFAFKSSQFTKGDGMPLIRIRDVGGDSADTNYVGEFDKRYLVELGDLLVGMDGDFNCARWRGPRGLLNQRVCKVTLQSDQYNPRFLDFALPGYLRAINDATSSVTVKHLSSRTIEDIPLPFPPLHEQEEIVAELEKQFSRLDEAVANLKRVKANLEHYTAAILQCAVEGRVSRDGSVSAEPPEDWIWGSCGDVIESIQAGASFKCVERPPMDGEVGVVKVSAVTWGEFDELESKTCLDPERVREELFIRPEDFLFSRANTIELVGACVIAKTVTKSLMLSDKILRFRLSAHLDPIWLLICLRSRFGRSEIERLATGNQESMRNIGQDRIRQIRLPIPLLTEQRGIAAEVDRRLSIVRELEFEVDAQLRRAELLRQAVLTQLIAGAN